MADCIRTNTNVNRSRADVLCGYQFHLAGVIGCKAGARRKAACRSCCPAFSPFTSSRMLISMKGLKCQEEPQEQAAPAAKPESKPVSVKIEDDWGDAIKKALAKKHSRDVWLGASKK